MSALTDVKELQGSRHSLKRLMRTETSPGALKKPKMKLKAAVAMRSLLNLLHITDRRRESLTDETSAASVIEDSITGHVPSKLSSLQTLQQTDIWLLDDKHHSLSKSWSYFVSDPKEASENENSTKNQTSDSLGVREGYFEHQHCQNDFNDLNANVTLVQRPLPCRVKMGISVLQGINTTKLYDHGMSCLEFKHQSESSRRQEPLSAISTDHTFALPVFKEEYDRADISNEGGRKTPLSDSSLLHKASFSSVERGICVEPSSHGNHFSFLPLKSTHNSQVTKTGPQTVDETCSPNNLTLGPSNVPVSSPRTDTTASSACFQDSRYESNLQGHVNKSNQKSHKFSVNHSLLPFKVTKYSKSSRNVSKLVNESPETINLMKHPTHLQSPIFATNSSLTSVEALQDRSALTSQHLVNQCLDIGESFHDAVVIDLVSPSCSMCSNRHASCPAVENDRSSNGEITTTLSSYQAAASVSMYPQQKSSLQSDYSSYSSPLVVPAPSQHILPPQPGIAAVPATIATTAAVNLAVPAPVCAARQLGSLEEPNVLLPKSARRCLHGHLKHHHPGALESNSVPKRAKILEYGTKSPTMSSYNVDSTTAVNVDCKKSTGLAHVSTVSKTSGSYDSHQTANCPLMSAVLQERTLHHSEKPSNVNFITAVCSVHSSKLPEIDVNGNFVVLLENGSVLSPRTEQHRTSVNVIPAPLLTSSPMHPKRKPSSNDEVLQPLQSFVSPVRHKPESKICRDISRDSTTGRRQRHRNNRHNRMTVYGNLDTSSDHELDFVSPRSMDYVLLTRAAGLIVNRIPFKKDIKPFINMEGLMQYLQSFYLSEIANLSSTHTLTISEYRTLKTESCQIFSPDQLTHETCLSELLASVLVQEPVLVQICSTFIFEHLRFLAGSSELYNMPPELFLMLLSNKGIVLGYHGFPLPYEESIRQVQRAGRKYIHSHKTGSVKKDSKLEEMLSFVIDQTAVMKPNHEDYGIVETDVKQLYHEIKYRQSEQFVTDKSFSEYRLLPNLSLTAAGSLRADPKVKSSDQVMPYDKYCSNAYILRKIYFSYIIQDKIPYISQIRQQYAVQGRKVTYSIGSSPSKPGFESLRTSSPDQNRSNPYAVCTTEASDSSGKVAALPKSDPLVTVAAAGSSPAACVVDSHSAEPAGCVKMSAVQLARGEHVTGIMVQGQSVLHNIMVITNKGRYIRAHGNIEFPGTTSWTIVPPPQESKYCLQAIVADSRTVSSQTYLQSVRVIWSVLCPMND